MNIDKMYRVRHTVRSPHPSFCLSPLRFKPHLNISAYNFVPVSPKTARKRGRLPPVPPPQVGVIQPQAAMLITKSKVIAESINSQAQ